MQGSRSKWRLISAHARRPHRTQSRGREPCHPPPAGAKNPAGSACPLPTCFHSDLCFFSKMSPMSPHRVWFRILGGAVHGDIEPVQRRFLLTFARRCSAQPNGSCASGVLHGRWETASSTHDPPFALASHLGPARTCSRRWRVCVFVRRVLCLQHALRTSQSHVAAA